MRREDPNGRQKARKDIAQAGLLLQALQQTSRALDIGLAWTEAWDRGPAWQAALTAGGGGGQKLPADQAKTLREAVITVCENEGKSAASYVFERASA